MIASRRSFSKELHDVRQNNPEAIVPGVRTHIPSAFPAGNRTEGGGTSQHILQTFHLLRTGIQPR